MARAAGENNTRLQIRMAPAHKARIARAAALQNMDLAEFVTKAALEEADAIIKHEKTTVISAGDFSRILVLLEHPPAPNAKLKAAIKALPDSL